jgi:hypothetical protein
MKEIIMTKKMIKFGLVCLMIVGIAFSISNIFQSDVKAAMAETQLDIYGTIESGNYDIDCSEPGRGCFTVTPEEN